MVYTCRYAFLAARVTNWDEDEDIGGNALCDEQSSKNIVACVDSR